MASLDDFLSTSDLMAARGVSKRTVHAWKSKGLPWQRGKHGAYLFDPAEVEQFLEDHNLAGATTVAPMQTVMQDRTPAARHLLAARVKKEIALAKKHEWDLKVRRGEFIHREEADAFFGEVAALVRGSLLALPARFASRWAAIDDTREMSAEIEGAVREVLEQLSRALDSEGAASAA